MKIFVKVSHFLHPFMALFISQSPWQWQSPWQLPKSGHMTLQTLSNHSTVFTVYHQHPPNISCDA